MSKSNCVFLIPHMVTIPTLLSLLFFFSRILLMEWQPYPECSAMYYAKNSVEHNSPLMVPCVKSSSKYLLKLPKVHVSNYTTHSAVNIVQPYLNSTLIAQGLTNHFMWWICGNIRFIWSSTLEILHMGCYILEQNVL